MWRREYPDLPMVVRVNMSPLSSHPRTSWGSWRTAWCERLPAERLCIEITEYAVVEEPEKVAAILRGFQKLGVEVALDDFGTGSRR